MSNIGTEIPFVLSDKAGINSVWAKWREKRKDSAPNNRERVP